MTTLLPSIKIYIGGAFEVRYLCNTPDPCFQCYLNRKFCQRRTKAEMLRFGGGPHSMKVSGSAMGRLEASTTFRGPVKHFS